MKMPHVQGAFADEAHFEAKKHAEFCAKNDLAACLRWVILDRKGEDVDSIYQMTDVDEVNKIIGQWREKKILKHVGELDADELSQYADIFGSEGAMAVSVGTGIGKDPLDEDNYEDVTMQKADATLKVADAFGVKRARIFNGYPQDKSGKPMERKRAMDKSLDVSQKVITRFGTDVVPFYENETGLLGGTGHDLADYHKLLNTKKALLLYDGANLVRIDLKREGLAYESYKAMRDQALAAFHLKDCIFYVLPAGVDVRHAQWPHVPVGQGRGAYPDIVRNIAENGYTPIFEQRLVDAGLSPQIVDLHEPHALFQSNVGGITGLEEFVRSLDAADTLYRGSGIRFQKFRPER